MDDRYSLTSTLIGTELNNYMEIMWEIDDMFVKDLDQVLFDNTDYQTAKLELVEEIKMELEPLKEIKKKDSIINKLPPSSEPERKEEPLNVNINIYDLTVDEILERIRCKCREFRDKFFRFADEADARSVSSDRKERKKEDVTMSVKELQSQCLEFQNVKDIAIKFIDNLLIEAEEHLIAQRTPISFDDSYDDLYAEGVIDIIRHREPEGDIVDSKVSSTESLGLPLIREFTPKAGRELILDAVRTWNLKKKWSYCIKFIQENSDTCSDFYVYEVIWSLPTMSYPIPQATASVFFTIEVSRVMPNICPVKVKYNFETERYKFSLEDDIQHEKFLNNILKCKISFFRTIRM